MTISRRSLILSAPALVLAPKLVLAQSVSTPSQSRGPFYPKPVPAERDFDLVAYNGGRATGSVMEMVGQVSDLQGTPIPNAIVEIWHCDTQGRYAHVGNNNGGAADADFQGFGAVKTASDGAYRFRTITPGVYPGRARHIHAIVRSSDRSDLTTQMYFPDEPENGADALFRRVRTKAERDALIAQRIDTPTPRYVFNIRLG